MATTTPAKRPTGRPTKLSPELTRKYCEGLRLGLTLEDAADYAGIHPGTVRNWLKKAETPGARNRKACIQFANAVKKTEADTKALLLGHIQQAARGGQWKAAAWILTNRFGMTKPAAPSVAVQINVGPDGQATAAAGPDVIDAEPTTAEEDARQRVARLERWTAAAEADRSWQAVARMEPQLDAAKAELRALTDGEDLALEEVPEEDFLVDLQAAAEEMPESHLRVFVDEYLARHRMTLAPDPDAEGRLLGGDVMDAEDV